VSNSDVPQLSGTRNGSGCTIDVGSGTIHTQAATNYAIYPNVFAK
jgi:hypothetical protein